MKTGNTASPASLSRPPHRASMEPGHEDREYPPIAPAPIFATVPPQWSPVMKTGNTARTVGGTFADLVPQWSPVMKTGNTACRTGASPSEAGPQWSPVMKTGNTGLGRGHPRLGRRASMEPGHEDREYGRLGCGGAHAAVASMEPGHEDREYSPSTQPRRSSHEQPQWSPVMKTGNTRGGVELETSPGGLNGARS